VESPICQLPNSFKRFGRHPETAESCATQLKPPYFHRKFCHLMLVIKPSYRLLHELKIPLVAQGTTNITRFCLIDGKAGQFVSNFDGKRASCHPLKSRVFPVMPLTTCIAAQHTVNVNATASNSHGESSDWTDRVFVQWKRKDKL